MRNTYGDLAPARPSLDPTMTRPGHQRYDGYSAPPHPSAATYANVIAGRSSSPRRCPMTAALALPAAYRPPNDRPVRPRHPRPARPSASRPSCRRAGRSGRRGSGAATVGRGRSSGEQPDPCSDRRTRCRRARSRVLAAACKGVEAATDRSSAALPLGHRWPPPGAWAYPGMSDVGRGEQAGHGAVCGLRRAALDVGQAPTGAVSAQQQRSGVTTSACSAPGHVQVDAL